MIKIVDTDCKLVQSKELDIANGSFCTEFMCVGCLAGVTCLRYTVLTSLKKGETAVHRCDPALSILAILVSRNVVSALQSIVFIPLVYERSSL